jgi:hypothetical protein
VPPLLEPKQEERTTKDANFGLVNALSNRVVNVEKMLQNQLFISPPKPFQQKKPYQYAKRNYEQKPRAQTSRKTTLTMPHPICIIELAYFIIVKPHTMSLLKLCAYLNEKMISQTTKIIPSIWWSSFIP